MFIKKRKFIIKKFSSFISFRNDRANYFGSDGYQDQVHLTWNVDSELENSMKSKLEADPEAKESFWAQYFLKMLLSPSQYEDSFLILRRHLCAYLQEACLKAAQDMQKEFRYIKHKYSLEEHFQIANIVASSPQKLFKNFSFERDKINIEGYAITAFKRFIRNQIYQQDLEARRTRFSNYGLLKNLSPGEFQEALLEQNFSREEIIRYRLVWQCFTEIYYPQDNNNINRIQSPSDNYLQDIAAYYNRRCSKLNISHKEASIHSVKEILEKCINAARSYRNKQFLPLEEAYLKSSENISCSWDKLIQNEEYQQIRLMVKKLFLDMPKICQIIFNLWLGLNLTQTEIAHIIGNKYPNLQKQYQIARQLKKYKITILKQFAYEWNNTYSDIQINSERDVEKIALAFDTCMKSYCEENLFSELDKIYLYLSDGEKKNAFTILNDSQSAAVNELCKDKYDTSKLNIRNSNQNLDEENIDHELIRVKIKIFKIFQNYLETSMDLDKNSLFVMNHKMIDLINEWTKSKQSDYI